MREGTVRSNDGMGCHRIRAERVFGLSLDQLLDKDSILEEVVGFKEEVQRSFEAISIEELLASNIGKKVKITLIWR